MKAYNKDASFSFRHYNNLISVEVGDYVDFYSTKNIQFTSVPHGRQRKSDSRRISQQIFKRIVKNFECEIQKMVDDKNLPFFRYITINVKK